MNETILLVEDNPDIMNINRTTLALRGYRVLCAGTLAQGERLLGKEVGLVVLDIMLPDGSGLDFCRRMRQTTDVPVLFLTALKENGDIVTGFDAGGDDYLPKPYDLDVFCVRVEALLRRAGRTVVAKELTRGPLRLDLLAGRAFLRGEDALLTQKEFAILFLLMENEGRTVRAETLYETAWGMSTNSDVRAVRPQVSRLRSKLGAGSGSVFDIVSQYGEGYCFKMNE